jgi:hypothetical protein
MQAARYGPQVESDNTHPCGVSAAAVHAVDVPSRHETLHRSQDQRSGSLSFPN